MLASALDSHPDIACGGELNADSFFGSKYGLVTGCLVKGGVTGRLLGFNGKYIYLTRKYEDIATSIQNTFISKNQPHIVMEPEAIKGGRDSYTSKTLDDVKDRARNIEEYMKGKTFITVDYDDMVIDGICSQIPENIARRLTDYLGIDYHPLFPQTYRPVYER